MDVLIKLPREHWSERDEDDYTLLHYACIGSNVAAVVALLQSGLVDVNGRNEWGNTPAHWAALYAQPRVLEILCAVGADLRANGNGGAAPIDCALINAEVDEGEITRMLVANGVRLSTVRKACRHLITPELEAFEKGVLRCRKAVIAMLRLKKAAKLWHVDKFLLRESGFAIWATRWNNEWQKTQLV